MLDSDGMSPIEGAYCWLRKSPTRDITTFGGTAKLFLLKICK